ncbi:Pentatricopeptide repeat-containing protein At4g31850 [Durusdinium trenchii]|uniref:Chloroplastic (Protein PROTON GRADIENT REGULATION 3) n=1 Tax=Durusdinium trenchii TaxID=1381693 RepID=A0ABP0IPB2_9DINO
MVKHWRCRRPIWLLAALLSLRGALPPAPPLFAFSPGMNKLNDLAEKGDVDGALHQLRRVLAELPSGHRPTVQMRTAFNTGIKACANAGNLKQAERLFAEMLQHRVAPNLKGLGKMMEAAAKVGNLSGAEHWFRQHERYGLAHESDEIARGQLIQAAAKAQDLKAAEEWFQELLQKGLQPSAWTLAALLEACARVGDVGKAKSLVAKCTALGIRTTDLHEFLLRKVYVKNNDLDSAEEQFRQISAPDLKDYAMVIDAAARCGNLTAAEQWFRRAQAGAKAEGRTVVGDEPMFVTLMFAAARAAELQRCEEWFQQAQKARLRPSSAMYTALVTAAAEALDTSAAQRWLQACPRPWPPEVLNTALRAAGLVGDEALAEAWAKQGMKDGMRLDSYSYRALLTGAARSQDTKGAQRWFQKALQEGEVEVNTCNAAIQAAARAGDVPLAKEMLKTMNQLVVQPDAVSYQGLLTSASNACDLAACEAFVAQASASGVPVRYAPVISCAAKVQGLKEAERWFQEALHSDSVDLFALNALVAAAARVGQLELAERYLHLAREMGEEPDIVTYTSLISAATTKGDLQAARKYVEEATTQGLKLDMVIMNTIISAAARAGDLRLANQVLRQALQLGLRPSTVTFGALISAALRADDLKEAESWLESCREEGLQPGAPMMTPFISYAARQKDLAMAESWFHRMLAERISPDVVTYGSMISVANKLGQADAADGWLQRAIKEKVAPNKICFGMVISALATASSIDAATQRLDDMVGNGFPAEAREVNAVLKACARASSSRAGAAKILDRIVSWRVHPDTMTKKYLERSMGADALERAALEHDLHFRQFSESTEAREPKVRPRAHTLKPAVQRQKKPNAKGQSRIYIRNP